MTTQTFGQRVDERPDGMYVPIHFPEFARLDTETRDGRTILSEGFGMDDAPRTLYFQKAQAPGHEGAVAVGRIDSMTIDGDLVTATGWLVDSPDARMAAHLVKTGVLRGNSVDLSVHQRDVMIDVEWSEEDDFPSISAKFRNASVTASTLVGLPAFHTASAIIPEGWDVEGVAITASATDELVAAGNARHALEFSTTDQALLVPGTAFANPELNEPTPLYVQGDGEVYGHLAAWGTRHLDSGVVPPRSHSGYAYFATGAVHTDAGDIIATGRIVIDGNHAKQDANWRGAIDHYANTCAAWADVAIGEDQHGIWLAGKVRTGTPEHTIAAARNSAVSGDWRSIGGHMELIAALSVNAPGFPIPRPKAYAVGSMQRSLTGAGVLRPRPLGLDIDPSFKRDISYIAENLRAQRARSLAAELELS